MRVHVHAWQVKLFFDGPTSLPGPVVSCSFVSLLSCVCAACFCLAFVSLVASVAFALFARLGWSFLGFRNSAASLSLIVGSALTSSSCGPLALSKFVADTNSDEHAQGAFVFIVLCLSRCTHDVAAEQISHTGHVPWISTVTKNEKHVGSWRMWSLALACRPLVV